MNAELLIAGLGCLLLALGHMEVGRRWILAGLTKEALPGTPFGSGSLTLSMVRFTWYVVSLFVTALGLLLITLALAPDADPTTLLLRLFGTFWLLATAMAVWGVRRRPLSLLRFPVPLGFLLVGMMCWIASA
jgi:hypothetical protein